MTVIKSAIKKYYAGAPDALVIYENDPEETKGFSIRGVLLEKQPQLYNYHGFAGENLQDADITTTDDLIRQTNHDPNEPVIKPLKRFRGMRDYYVVRGFVTTESQPDAKKNIFSRPLENGDNVHVRLFTQKKHNRHDPPPPIPLQEMINRHEYLFDQHYAQETERDLVKQYGSLSAAKEGLQKQLREAEKEVNAIEELVKSDKIDSVEAFKAQQEPDNRRKDLEDALKEARKLERYHHHKTSKGFDYMPRSVITELKKLWRQERESTQPGRG